MKQSLVLALLCLFIAALVAQAQVRRPQQATPRPGQLNNTNTANRQADVLTHTKNHVLLIGVNQYWGEEASEDRLFDDLHYCVNDMKALKDALVKARFCRAEDIQLLASGVGGNMEPTGINVQNALRTMLEKVQQDDRVLVAFAGHGISLQVEGRPVDFLCFADARVVYNRQTGELAKEGLIRRSELEEQLDQSVAGTKLVFIDACRNLPETGLGDDPKSRRLAAIQDIASFGSGVQSDVKNQGFFRFSSCRPGEMSWETPEREHGVFTHFLIEGMLGKADDRNRGVITLADLQTYVRKETSAYVTEKYRDTQFPISARLPLESEQTEAEIFFSFWEPTMDQPLFTQAETDRLNRLSVAQTGRPWQHTDQVAAAIQIYNQFVAPNVRGAPSIPGIPGGGSIPRPSIPGLPF